MAGHDISRKTGHKDSNADWLCRRRWYKDVGLGFRTPKTAIEGSYIGTRELETRPSQFHRVHGREGLGNRKLERLSALEII